MENNNQPSPDNSTRLCFIDLNVANGMMAEVPPGRATSPVRVYTVVYTYIYIYNYIHAYTYTYIHTYIYTVHMFVSVYVMCMCLCTCVYAYIRVGAHVHYLDLHI